MLTIQQESPIALPKLNDLMFFLATDDPTSVSGLNLEIFVAMLKSRWDVEGCARIRHVHIDTGWWHGLPFIEGLLSRLVEFDDRELSLWLTDFTPAQSPSGDATMVQVSRRLRWN
ncbi:hypothetical protein C8J57DRAFT_1732220 [Mycena rebaudengoi]|nr:hypothetical protein C8J57DRAFT_1732220 [Mycena rebaudengoi]